MRESMKVVAAIEVPPRRHPRSANDEALRFARSCYDHLAGQVGVAVTDALVAMGHIVLTDEGGEVTSSGGHLDRKSTRLNSSHANISYAVFCLKKKDTI